MQENFIKKIWKHKVHINYTLHETGRVKGFYFRSGLVLIIGLVATVGSLSYTGYSQLTAKPMPIKIVANVDDATSELYEEEIRRLYGENSTQEKQIKIFARELGVIQARLDRFDAIGEKLFDNPEISTHLEGIEAKGSSGADYIDEANALSIEMLNQNISLLQQRADEAEVVMQSGLNLLAMNSVNKSQKPHFWPVVHERTRLTSNYGKRSSPFNKNKAGFHKSSIHGGIDIAGGYNAQIVSTADGVVVFSGYRYNYGITVEIRHANGISSRYAHLNKSVVKNGQKVTAGEHIAMMGSTGRSTGPHLHFELLIGDKKIDPYPFVKATMRQGRILAANWDGVDKVASLK